MLRENVKPPCINIQKNDPKLFPKSKTRILSQKNFYHIEMADEICKSILNNTNKYIKLINFNWNDK